jgi:hypothetical protein
VDEQLGGGPADPAVRRDAADDAGTRLAPGIARISPYRYIIDAMRQAYAGQYWNAIMAEGLCVAAGTAALFLWLGSRVFVHENA